MIPFVLVGQASDLAAATVLSRWRGSLRVTVICKATLGFVPDGEMVLAPAVEMVAADVHTAKNPMRSVRVSSDLSPHLERADVLFVGRAHAPPGTKVERTTVRLALVDDRVPVLDKRLAIVGDRDAAGAKPRPFDTMPIIYERAFGGLGFPDNPLGVGVGVGGDGKLQPNVLDPDPTRPRTVAGFGPRSTSWLVRKKLLRGHPRPPTEGIAELPDDVDWIYFQAAPPDQWLETLPPRAWIVLEGLNARTNLLRMRLPAMRAWARLEGPGLGPGVGAPLELRPDTLFIDGDAEHCTVAWRKSFHVASVEALTDAWASVAMEMPGRPLAWPPRPPRSGADADTTGVGGPRRLGPGSVKRRSHPMSGTVALDDLPPRRTGLAPTHASSGTMIVDGDAMAAAAATGPKQPAAGTMIIEAPAPETNLFGTLVVANLPPAAQPLPFVGGSRATKRQPAAPLPGAPWAPDASTPTPRRAAHPLAETQAPPSTFFPGKGGREAERARVEQAARADAARVAVEASAKEEARAREEAAALALRVAEREVEARAAAVQFAKEQSAARKTDAEREAAAAAERARGIQDLKKKAYGGFDD